MTESIKVGAVVQDWYQRVGIVCAKRPEPPADWINDQRNSEDIKRLGRTDWWAVMPLEGGYVLVPGPLLSYLRDATYDDFLEAADTANSAGRETLLKLFPDYVKRVLAERRTRGES